MIYFYSQQGRQRTYTQNTLSTILLVIPTVPVLYEGPFNEALIKALWKDSNRETQEGYVVRLSGSFTYSQFPRAVAKFVRKGHVQTTKHNWQTQPVIPNGLQKDH
jgi:hypothetical protein